MNATDARAIARRIMAAEPVGSVELMIAAAVMRAYSDGFDECRAIFTKPIAKVAGEQKP